jgi:RimJ/RimL family protein N-acetyltransferase
MADILLVLLFNLLLFSRDRFVMSQSRKEESCIADNLVDVREVSKIEAAEWLYRVLQEEDEESLTNVDGKGFGRPLSQHGIEAWLGPTETPSGIYSSAVSFLAYEGDRPAAHCGVKAGVVHQYKNGIQVGYLVVVYTATEFRSKGMASAVVRAATAHAFSKLGMEEVAFLVFDRNTAAQAFYKGLGFRPTDIKLNRGGLPMTLWTIELEEFTESVKEMKSGQFQI